MANSTDLQVEELADVQDVVPLPIQPEQPRFSIWQIARFGTVGILNASIDILTLNILLFRFPTHNVNLLIAFNTIAYTLGALNSYFLNKYWTFRHKQATTGGELLRFATVNVAGILCNDAIIWLVAGALHPLIANALIWANTSKVSAAIGTAIVSYLGMRLWVFTQKPQPRRGPIDRALAA